MSELTTTNNQTQAAGTGLFNFSNFTEVVKAANMLANSNIVPETYRAVIVKKSGWGDSYREERIDNPNAVANCLIALNMSNRMGADPLMIMQNLYLIEGRPAWSSTFIIAGINSCGRFGTLNFEFTDLGNRNIEYQETSGYGRNKKYFTKTANVNDFSCVAWAIDKETGNRVESSPITLELAIKEGWYFKRGSKWPTMPEQMAKYRAAAFFGRLYAPEVMMGIYTKDEVEDFTQARDVTPQQEPSEQPQPEPQIQYIDDEQVDILTKMIACVTNPKSVANIKKAIPDVRLIPANHFDYYQNKLKATIDMQVIKDEQASYAQQQNTQSADPNDYVEVIADDGGQYNVYDNQQEMA
ncbi:recombinase RecT [Psychrobacter celer]|uniref:recombinase RecT n=1 Tax=Psychrobacter celer TaxID=306572 RepID=UPI003FD62759